MPKVSVQSRFGGEQGAAIVALLFMPLFFSSNVVIGRGVGDAVEPWTLAFFRWAIAALILLPFAAHGLKVHRDELREAWVTIGVLGLLGMWLCGALVYMALRATTATNGTLIYTTSPIFILLIDWLVRGRPLKLVECIGILLAILGVVVIVTKGSFATLLALEFNIGDMLFVICAISWAIYSVILKSPGMAGLPTRVSFAAIAIAGAISLFPFMVWEATALQRFPVTGSAWLSILGLAIVPSVLAFGTFQFGVRVFGSSLAGMFMYLLPVYGVALAVIFLGESLQAHHFVGFVAILSGLVLATGRGLWLIDRLVPRLNRAG